jgi:hypothetical protein
MNNDTAEDWLFAMGPDKWEPGQHFWAKMDDKLVMMMKSDVDEYHVCGAWECGVRKGEFDVIKVISLPAGFSNTDLYYLLNVD